MGDAPPVPLRVDEKSALREFLEAMPDQAMVRVPPGPAYLPAALTPRLSARIPSPIGG